MEEVSGSSPLGSTINISRPRGWYYRRMSSEIIALAVVVIFSAIGVAGDSFINIAGNDQSRIKWAYFFVGFAIYAFTAFGWLFAMRHIKLATLGVYYSLTTIILLALVGNIFFREKLNAAEVIGILFAIVAMFLVGFSRN